MNGKCCNLAEEVERQLNMSSSTDYSGISETCCVCLCRSPKLMELTSSKGAETESWFSKLQKCVAEINWSVLFVICQACSNQLDFVYNFRQLCFQSQETRHATVSSQQIKDESLLDTESVDEKCHTKGIHESLNKCPEFNSNIFPCKECALCFISQSDVDEHFRKVHTGDDGFDDDSFNDASVPCSSDSDLDSDANLKLWSVKSKRQSKAKQMPKMKEPTRSRHDAETEICKTKYVDLKCHTCGEMFNSVPNLVEHSVTEHRMQRKDVKPYVCPKCPWRFRIPYSLRDHIKFHDNIRNEICSYCGKGFVTKIALITHEKQHLNLREYQCPHCPKRFNTSKDIRTHKYVVHTDPSKWKHVCSVCNKRFPVKSNFDAHVRRHNNEKPYGCHLCDAKFCEGASLRIHIQRHSNVREYKCSECGNEYKTLKYLQQHKNKKHNIGNTKICEKVKKYVCNMCPKAFYAKNKLTRHLCTHTGERPFACSVCDKRFTDKSYVTQHIKTVHNYIPDND